FPENFITVNPQFRNAQIYGNNNNGTYHSMEVKVTRRLAQGFSSQFTYTWSKAIGNAVSGPQVRSELGVDVVDPRNLHANYGRLPFDRTQVVSAHGTWDLPFAGKHKLLANSPRFIQRVAGDWQLSGILSWDSGAPLNVATGSVYTVAFS